MGQTLTLPDELYSKLAQGAERRGLTIEALLGFISEAVLTAQHASDQERSRRIGRLLAKHRAGPVPHEERAELEALIDADYRDAIARADRLIAAQKQRRGRSPRPSCGPAPPRSVGKRSRT